MLSWGISKTQCSVIIIIIVTSATSPPQLTTNINKQQAGQLTPNLPSQALNIQLELCQLESVSDIHEHVTLCDSVTMHQICGMIQTKY